MYCEAALGVMTELTMVIKGRAASVVRLVLRGVVLLSTMRAEAKGAREIRVPDIVIAEAPGISVWLPMIYSEALLGSIVVPSMVSGGRGVALLMRAAVIPPMTIYDADGARLISVPEILMPEDPGISVWLPIKYSEALLGNNVVPSMVSGGRGLALPVRVAVVLPMTIFDADGARLIGVPEILMPEAPGISVWLPITYSESLLGIIVVPSMVSGGRGAALLMRAAVIPPTTIYDADGARLIGVPKILIPEDPGIRVWLPIMYSEALLGNIVVPYMVSSGRGLALSIRAAVMLPTTIFDADGARLIGVPETVTAGAPGMIVWLPIIYSEALLGNTGFPPNVRACSVIGGVGNGRILPPNSAFDADEGRLMGVPDTMMAGDPAPRVWPSKIN